MPNTTVPFTPQELENSFPLDVTRRFREPAAVPLLATISQGMQACEKRLRRRNGESEKTFAVSVEVLLANLTAAHMNVIDRSQYVAVSFNKNDYGGSELSIATLCQCRDYLMNQGLIDVAPGFQRWDADGVGRFGRRTRLRATEKLREAIDRSGLHRRSISRTNKAIIQIKAPGTQDAAIPADVNDSRALLEAINDRLAGTDISLDSAMIATLTSPRVENEGEEADVLHRKRTYAGDLTATSLYRVFKHDWHNGGRIYGGWWMSLPRAARPYLRINGSPAVELDFKALHPFLLYSRTSCPMPDDPYVIDSPCSERVRQLGKRTFNRLLNRKEDDPIKRLKIKASSGDRDILGKVPFRQYLDRFTYRLTAIHQWFGTGEGLRLQYEDSVLALRILQSMENQGIPTLPIHDSFIVAEAHEDNLRAAMTQAFHSYGSAPEISRKASKVLPV